MQHYTGSTTLHEPRHAACMQLCRLASPKAATLAAKAANSDSVLAVRSSVNQQPQNLRWFGSAPPKNKQTAGLTTQQTKQIESPAGSLTLAHLSLGSTIQDVHCKSNMTEVTQCEVTQCDKCDG